MKNAYKISVITAVLDSVNELPGTIESVAEQDYPEIEHIIVDGGSTDGTLELIERSKNNVDRCIRGPDSGIAEAMNKGVAAATGDFVLFLHADDRFFDDTALRCAVAHIDNSEAIWAFDINFGDGDAPVRSKPRPFNTWVRFKNPLPHQGVLCPRQLLQELGGFDESFRIDMDYDFWLRAYLAAVPLRRVPEILAVMGDAGVSSQRDWDSLSTRFLEEKRVQKKHARGMVWRLLYGVYWPPYLAYRRMRTLLGWKS